MVFEDPRGSGVAADGMVEATAVPGPRLTLVLDPKAKRFSLEELARHVATAFDEALRDLREKVATGGESVPDLALLAELLADVQSQVHNSLGMLGARLNAALAAAGDRARLDVAATVRPTVDLFDRTRETLAMAQRGAEADPDVRGRGTALGGDVRAVAAIGRIESVEIERGAMKAPAADLADALAEAANAAMRDLEVKARTAGPVDRTKIKERTGEIRRLSVENMTAHAQAIADLLDRLEPPGTDEWQR
jgi:hypothetical protein